MADDKEALDDSLKKQEIIEIACVHCGKTLFKFSKNALNFDKNGYGEIKLICPHCNSLTKYSSNGRIEAV